MTVEGELTLGVIVCCRDEERVIERRLRNLALSQWPLSARPHRVLVVDDGSRDKTASIGRSIGASVFPGDVKFELVENRARPGKAGAITTGIAQLAAEVDLLVLTDADVVNDPSALTELSVAFRIDPRLGMACGSQTFVRSLPSDGTIDTQGMREWGTSYDRLTAWVRALENRAGGRVFSVHGQLLAWRAELNLAPKLGLAADDLDLMREVRRRGQRVGCVAKARFFELRPWTRALRRAQALRRARAYFQFAGTMDATEFDDRWTRAQWRFYKHFPRLFPWIVAVCLILVVVGGAWKLWDLSMDLRAKHQVGLQVLWLVLARYVGRRLWDSVSVIEEARQMEQTASMDDQWSTAR